MSSAAQTIAANVAAVQERITAACQRVGRNPQEVQLVAVSKKMPLQAIRSAAQAGIQHFGENRIEEARDKIPQLTDLTLHWHMIGHLQSRKAKAAVELPFTLLHSLDSLKLAQRLDAFAQDAGRRLDVLLECNVSGEASKGGWQAHEWEQNAAQRAELWHNMKQVAALPHLNIMGLMTMAPLLQDIEATRPVFQALARLREALRQLMPDLPLPHLSMGMSDDFEIAVEEGASIVRIGRAIFGERPVV